MLLTTVRTRRFGRQSAFGEATSACAAIGSSLGRREARGAATDRASVSAIFAACFGSQKQSGGSGCGSSAKVWCEARIRQAFFVSRQPSPDRCTPRPCPGSRVRARPPSHSTTASSGGASGRSANPRTLSVAASRRAASSPPTSPTTRCTVLSETTTSPTFLRITVARVNERVSAAEKMIRSTSPGDRLRASKPNVSRIGKKRSPTARTVSDQLLQVGVAVNRFHGPALRLQRASRTAVGTLGRYRLRCIQLPHLLLLYLTAELFAQLMGSPLD